MVTVVVSGPQATGNTTLAMALGRALGAPVFSRDPLMAVLWDVVRSSRVPATGLRLQTALLARQLELGQSAVLECVAPHEVRQPARRAGGGCQPTVGAPAMAGRLVCGTCGGRGSKTEQVRRRDTCGRCGGAGGKKSGKIWVPCSACGGAGGRDRTSYIQVTCRSCGGSGLK